jgi:hypothetical protein
VISLGLRNKGVNLFHANYAKQRNDKAN